MSTNTLTPPVLEIHGLSKSYAGVRAVADVDLSVGRGEILALVGKNGAGKSTLIKIAAGAVKPDGGAILLDGRPQVTGGPAEVRRSGIAVLHQELNLAPGLSVAENVGLGAGYPRHAGILIDRRALHKRVASLLADVELDVDPAVSVDQLSPVEQRLTMLAAALWVDAKLLILDEPTASLTEPEIDRLHQIVRRLSTKGVGIIYVSHRLDEVLRLADRIVVMQDGEVTANVASASVDKRRLVELISGIEGLDPRASQPAAETVSRDVVLRASVLRPRSESAPLELSVHAGEILGIAGLVGSGRTTLLRMIYGAQPRAGSVTVHGTEVRAGDPRASLAAGVVFLTENRATQGLLPGFSVERNITVASLADCRRQPWLPLPSRRRERAMAESFVDRLSIKLASTSLPVTALSGGNQQKVLLARWLATGPKVLLLDEPTVGIDADAKEDLYAFVGELAKAGVATLLVSSDFDELAAHSHRALIMANGEFAGEVSGSDMTEGRLVAAVFEAMDGPHGKGSDELVGAASTVTR